jgi:DUF1680 family protein
MILPKRPLPSLASGYRGADGWRFDRRALPAYGRNPQPGLPTSRRRLPVESVCLLDGSPFCQGGRANREYVLALDPKRLLAPFRREAGLPLNARPYGNWESSGLDGHTAGHYLSALAHMIAAGEDAPDGELRRRLDFMVDGLKACQDARGDGFIGGVPNSNKLWAEVASGNVQEIFSRWAPWYNVHKTFAGLRDAYVEAGNAQARDILVRLGDWCIDLTSRLSDDQMQRMLDNEYGGMNEVMANIYEITGNKKYLETAQRFNHKAVLDPLLRQQDQLTGKHANTQIPKVVGLERIARLTGDNEAHGGARFFWDTVTQRRSVLFGGNSVSEHFNDPNDFHGMLVHREGPETCNTYNMLRLTKELFAEAPDAAYADYYERALFNHILASLDSANPGYVYFTPIRPNHYRVYSTPDQGFWCCVGTGMENPGKYGEFIYARAGGEIYVNLFIASELTVADLGLRLRQETAFPDEEQTQLTLALEEPKTFTLQLRCPGWVAPGKFAVQINRNRSPSARAFLLCFGSSSWRDGDRVNVHIPMHTTSERLPDGSSWYAILHGPIVLAHPAGTWEMTGLRADDSRMAHVAAGPTTPLDQAPVLLTSAEAISAHVVPDPAAGSLHFRLKDIVEPSTPDGLSLIPFFRLHESRYQMYWEGTTHEGLAARKEQVAAAERARIAREKATLDWVAPGEQQSDVEHASGAKRRNRHSQRRRWRHGRQLQCTRSTPAARRAPRCPSPIRATTGPDVRHSCQWHADCHAELVAEKRGDFIESSTQSPTQSLLRHQAVA